MPSDAMNQIIELPASGASRPVVMLRMRGTAVALACAGVVALSAWLTPRPSGHGTHMALGMPGCSWLMRTGWPCPSCGMTTSFAWMARGRVDKAFLAQPFAVVLFLAVAGLGVLSAIEAVAARDMLGRLRPRVWWLFAGTAGLLAGWAFKAAWGAATGVYPLH